MRRLLSFSVLVLISLLFSRQVYADTPPTLTAYHEQIRAAYAAAQRSDRIGLDELATTLEATHSVRLDDGTELPVDNSWLKPALAQEPPSFPVITAQLGAILEAMNQPHTRPRADALHKLQGIFNVPPFHDRAVPSAFTTGWRSFWGAVGRALQRLFDWMFGGASNPGSTARPTPPTPATSPTTWTGLSGWGLFWLALGLLLVIMLVVYAVRGVKGSLIRDAHARRSAEAEVELTANAALERAEAETMSGDYRNAVQFLYLSSLLWLHEQHLLRYDHALTNREYLEQLAGKPLQGQLAPIVETFDRVWYGKSALAPDEFQAYEARIAQLRTGAETTA